MIPLGIRRIIATTAESTALATHDTPQMNSADILDRITTDPRIFGGKPIIRGRRLAVEHVLEMLAAGDTPETILQGYDWLEPDDIRACLAYAQKLVAHERIEPVQIATK
jgi:uncharacterized protein (DUF433 family)